jgi:membrane-associated phospholipid phosphatase
MEFCVPMKCFIAARRHPHRTTTIAIATLAFCFANPSWAGESKFIWEDTKAYFTAPLRWDGTDWLYFAGSLAAVGVAHKYDDDVRAHFIAKDPTLLTDTKSYELADAAPAAVAFLGTWAFAAISDDRAGRGETWAMAEATALSATTGLILKFAAGRERPSKTSDPNSWRAGGDSFPSLHATAAFAIGTVLAESGNEDYRWVRRAVGYGIGVATSYERLKHNQHWLSDTVAGAALGISSAHFAMGRREGRNQQAYISVAPMDGGLLLTYSMPLQ